MGLKNALYWISILSICCSASGLAASKPELKDELRLKFVLAMKDGRPLTRVYSEIQSAYGKSAISALTKLAQSDRERDEIRWASLFSLSKISTESALPVIRSFFTAKSWMLRDAALKDATAVCLSTACPDDFKDAFKSKLKDASLIVRTTAVDSISALSMKGLTGHLIQTLNDPQNTHKGKPLWIHDHALRAIEKFQAKEAMPNIVDLLSKTSDAAYQRKLINTLEVVSGKKFANKTVNEQLYLWRRLATEEKTF